MSLTTSDGLSFRELVFSDLERYQPGKQPTWRGVLARCLSTPGMVASLILRAQQSATRRGHTAVASILRTIGSILVGADFVPGLEVGPGLWMPHPNSVVIGNGATIGANVTVGAGVTFGAKNPTGASGEFPVICDGAIILTHAVVAGAVRVGQHAQVGANSVVLDDVADYAVVFGVPATKVADRDGRIPGAG